MRSLPYSQKWPARDDIKGIRDFDDALLTTIGTRCRGDQSSLSTEAAAKRAKVMSKVLVYAATGNKRRKTQHA